MRVCICGVGLIGGSVALAARARRDATIVGTDPDPAALRRALAAGVIDEAVDRPQDERAAELWVVAAPIGALGEVVRAACAAAPADAVITDVGSVKQELVAAIADERFVGGHPLAGAETAGVDNAREDLFEGATWYLTPRPETSGVAYERLHRFVAALGARPVAIDAARHDAIMAAISHLPHVLANVNVERACAAGAGDGTVQLGPSLRDATRVAGANPKLWAQIYAANAPALAAELDAVIARLQDVRGRLGDLEAWQADVREQRTALLESAAPGGPLGELDVTVPNRPGVVAQLALTLGEAGINIADLALAPSPGWASGVVTLWVPAADLDRARELVSTL